MTDSRIIPEKVTRPFQLLAAWLTGLVLVDGAFLTAAVQIRAPGWLPAVLVLASVLNVPVFLVCIFLLQTRFRPEMQEDVYYSKYLEQKSAGFRIVASTIDLAPSRASALSYQVCVLNRTTALSEEEIRRALAALQTQVHRDLAPAWGVDAALTYVGPREAPPAGSWWLEIADESPLAGAVAYHDVTPEGLPQARVCVKPAKAVGINWTVAASHELLEMLVNPRPSVVVLVEAEGQPTIYAYQIADPCSSDSFAYSIDGVQVSDFVLPAWFEPERKPGTTLDFSRQLKKPLQVGAGGYAMIYEAGKRGRWRTIYGSESP